MVLQIERQQPPGFSLGAKGWSLRPDSRAFVNVPRYGTVADVEVAEDFLARAIYHMNRRQERMTRFAARGIVGRDFLHAVPPGSELDNAVEGVVPVINGNQLMVMFGVNHSARIHANGDSIALDINESSVVKAQGRLKEKPPVEQVRELRDQGFTFISEIPEDEYQLDQVCGLWQSMFGRTQEEVLLLRQKLIEAKNQPDSRSVWFSAIFKDDQIVSLAMAEALDIAGVLVVESTEWATHPDFQRNGYGPAVVSHLTAQVVHDLRGRQEPWVVYAETNLYTEAHKTGIQAGFVFPERYVSGRQYNHILKYSTSVDGRLTHFALVHLPQENIDAYYGVDKTAEILEYSVFTQ